MPLYALRCLNDHDGEEFCHHPEDRGARTVVCPCGSTMAPVLSVGAGMTWFRENAGRWITNLGDRPVYITSPEQHRAEMKKAGVDWATKWPTQGTGGWL